MPNPNEYQKAVTNYKKHERRRKLTNKVAYGAGASITCFGLFLSMVGIMFYGTNFVSSLEDYKGDGEESYSFGVKAHDDDFSFSTYTDSDSFGFSTYTSNGGYQGPSFSQNNGNPIQFNDKGLESSYDTLLAGTAITFIGLFIMMLTGIKQFGELIYYGCSKYQQQLRLAAEKDERKQNIREAVEAINEVGGILVTSNTSNNNTADEKTTATTTSSSTSKTINDDTKGKTSEKTPLFSKK